MPLDPEKVKKLDAMMDEFLAARKDDYDDEDEEGNTDPIQFGKPPRYSAVAEPPDDLNDSTPTKIRGAPKRDLFS